MNTERGEWLLDDDQYDFIFQHMNEIEEYLLDDDYASIDELVLTREYQELFDDMDFDDVWYRFRLDFEG